MSVNVKSNSMYSEPIKLTPLYSKIAELKSMKPGVVRSKLMRTEVKKKTCC